MKKEERIMYFVPLFVDNAIHNALDKSHCEF
jgi:hypothetical protein